MPVVRFFYGICCGENMILYFVAVFILNVGILAFLIYSVRQKILGRPNRFLLLPSPHMQTRFGIELGLKLSAILSFTYAFLGILIVQAFVESDWGSVILIWVLGLPHFFSVAILPAIAYGILTGVFLEKFVRRFNHFLSVPIVILSGVIICIAITVLSHYLFGIQINFSFVNVSTGPLRFGIYETYPFYIGIPSMIYIFSGGWAGWYIYKKIILSDS